MGIENSMQKVRNSSVPPYTDVKPVIQKPRPSAPVRVPPAPKK